MSAADAETRAVLLRALRDHGASAINRVVCEALDASAAVDDTNALTWLGNRASYHLRRAVLLEAMKAHGWNLAQTGKALRMGSTPHVLRMIRDLGLQPDYDRAKVAGIPRRGGRPVKKKEVTK